MDNVKDSAFGIRNSKFKIWKILNYLLPGWLFRQSICVKRAGTPSAVIRRRSERRAMPQTLKKGENDVSNFLLLLTGKFILFVGPDLLVTPALEPLVGNISLPSKEPRAGKPEALLTNNSNDL